MIGGLYTLRKKNDWGTWRLVRKLFLGSRYQWNQLYWPEATAEYFVTWELCTRHPSNHVNEVLWPLLLKRSELGLALSLFSVCHGIKGMFAEVNLEKKNACQTLVVFGLSFVLEAVTTLQEDIFEHNQR